MSDFDKEEAKRNENEETEKECMDDSVMEQKNDSMEEEESIEMEAEVIPAEEAELQEVQAKQTEEAQAEQNEQQEEMPRPSVREYHYEEKVKKSPRKKKGWAKFIAGCLIVSVAGGGSMGVGYGLTQNYLQSKKPVVTTTISAEKAASTSGAYSAVDIVKAVKPSVVSISTTISGTAQYFGAFAVPYEGQGAGSGVIFYSDDSRVAIATNNHVIEEANAIYVIFDGDKSVPAKVIGTKSESDLAVLSVSWDDLKAAGINEVTTATFGDSDALQVGESVIAIGNAMGRGLSATDGIISMTEQNIKVDGNTLQVLQTSAAINGGNSGGALVNSRGEVIGINTAKYNSSMAEGMGYAIPSNVITPIVDELLETGTQPKPYIGIIGTSITEETASQYKLPIGALIMEVTENGPAAQAGLQVGDVITQYDGKTVMDMNALVELVNNTEIGKTVDVHVVRDGEKGIDLKIKISDKNS